MNDDKMTKKYESQNECIEQKIAHIVGLDHIQ